MDDLLGEDWQKPSKPTITSSNPSLLPTTFAHSVAGFRASPFPSQTGVASPQNISRPSSTLSSSAKSQNVSNDQFGSLLAHKSPKSSTSNVSIQERQRQLLEQKRHQQELQAAMWDNLGSGTGTPEVLGPSRGTSRPGEDSEEDIMAAFNKDAPVNLASHFPPPSSETVSRQSTPFQSHGVSSSTSFQGQINNDDDDPFDLGSMTKQLNSSLAPQTSSAIANNDDDILGDLAKPVSQRPTKLATDQPTRTMGTTPSVEKNFEESIQSHDRPLAELVDMGFPPAHAKVALAESGGDVQGAVGWLLQQAHEESRQKAGAETAERRQSPSTGRLSPQRPTRHEQDAVPPWLRQESRPSSAARREDSRSPASNERDAAHIAQEYGNKLFKGASSLWKASQKQMAKTMAEFQQERDPSQPKWMQDTGGSNSRPTTQLRQAVKDSGSSKTGIDVTNEAAMLDMPRERPQKPPVRPAADRLEKSDLSSAGGNAPAEPLPRRPAAQPKFMQPTAPVQANRPITKLTRQDLEEQSAEVYVSPARRKRPAPKPQPPQEAEVDLFNSPLPQASSVPQNAQSIPISQSPLNRPKSQVPPRNIPSTSPGALSTSTQHRKAGGEAYKRGDFAAAHLSYSEALRPIPSTHPVAIIIFTNRALTGIKTGDAKLAVSDAEQALAVIGEGQGIGETIDLGAGEGSKDMREFFGKALMRKAEALEHLEKWSEAASVWRVAVGAGVGGAVASRGRDRCDKAAAPKASALKSPVQKTAPTKAPPAKSLGSSLQRPTLTDVASAEAIKKLRAANAAAEKADDEKFALVDQVDNRLNAWKGGKSDNLRALLQSLDSVLWDGAGWKKVGMSDLVMPNKVKIVYMKAIAKVHPDKIPQDATTEQKMVSAAVFSTLNEAWDKFKRDNNL